MKTSNNRSRPVVRLLKLILPIVVLAVCVVIAFAVLNSKPTASRTQAQPRQARLVTVTPAEAAPATLTLSANGTVEAADATELRARVSGQITSLADKLAPGTRFAKDDVLATIDPSDYRLALTNARGDLASARAALRVEQGQQAVARRELALVGSDVSAEERDLALRGPQLEQARADVQTAQTAVDQAQLDLDRTQVRAPFAGIVTERSTSVGNVVTTSDTLATIAATDVYWVNVSLPVDQLRWLQAADGGDNTDQSGGSAAKVYYPDAWGAGAFIDASVLRIQPSLESEGRMARVLLRVPDPLGRNAPDGARLLLGAYVQAGIRANIPSGSVLLDAAFVHENNQIWVMSSAETLDIRSVNIAYRDATQAVIAAGLQPGERVITSELTAPIQGMAVRLDTTTADTAEPTPAVTDTTDVNSSKAAATGPGSVDRSLMLRMDTTLGKPDTAAQQARRSTAEAPRS